MPTVPIIDTRNPHPLPPDGSFRGGRLPAALSPDYVRVEEMNDADWVELCRRLADFLVYYDNSNLANGNWQTFFNGQPVVETARLLAWPLKELSQLLADHRERIEDHEETISKALLLSSLFDAVSSVAYHLDRLTKRLYTGTPLKERSEAIIRHQLGPALRRWLAYYQHVRAELPESAAGNLPENLRKSRAVGGSWIDTASLADGTVRLSDLWAEAGGTWLGFVGGPIAADGVVFGSLPELDERINHAVGHTFFHGVYDAFVSSTLHLRTVAQNEWLRLQNDPNHAPHLALLLAFLEARNRQREMLNALTNQHLHYYYNRVLRTKEKPTQMPRALLHLEARKNLENTFLAAGTIFRGDKDEATKQERQFASLESLTVTGAILEEQRAIRKVGDDDQEYAAATRGKLYAARTFNTVDGEEEAAPPETASFHPFGYRNYDGSGKLVPGMSPARFGLAIASHYLYLREGERTISLIIRGAKDLQNNSRDLPVKLSTEEGWLEKEAEISASETGETVLTITLTGGDPAILPIDPEVHGTDIDTRLPVCQLLFDAVLDWQGWDYERLRAVKPTGMTLTVDVENIRNNALSGSGGVLDASKPFAPFGPTPGAEDVLYIGNKEVFQKAGAVINVNYDWKENTVNDAQLKLSVLKNGSFEAASEVFKTGSIGWRARILPDFSPDVPYFAGAPKGYLAWEITADLGYQNYLDQLRDFIADPENEEAPTPPPGGPELSYLSLSYVATTELVAPSTLHFLTPFGSYPVPDVTSLAVAPPLLPEHNLGADAGAMLLGFAGWDPGSQLSLAIKVEDGTANPLLRKPDNHLRWHYLKNNLWTSLDGMMTDGTAGLLRSGLVRIDLPYDLKIANSRFCDERVWIRLSVGETTDAVNWVQGIHPNGVEVVMDPANGATAPAEPLAEGTIAKLLYPQAGVKKVHQPYPTFGGVPAESQNAYFTRLSESLRHKDRGITEWDLEHLILEAFPEVERVVCLQHLQYEPGETAADAIYHELRAGHFTILPLGRARGLLPYVSLATREAIEAFVLARVSGHATVHIRNPRLEGVRVTAQVYYLEGTDKNWADGQIQEDLIEFLSPWRDAGLGQLNFSADVHRSTVMNFIEELVYVDYVKELVLSIPARPGGGNPERLSPENLVSMLVSADEHAIDGRFSERSLVGAAEQCPIPTISQRRGGLNITPKVDIS